MALRWSERWVLSYIFDYVIVIVFIAGFSALDLIEPYHQHFSLDNQSIQYPFAVHERVTAAQAGLIACFFPLAMIAFWTMLVDGQFSHKQARGSRSRLQKGPWTLDDRLWEMNCGILGLGLAVGGAIVVTGALKNCVGKPRPDLISRCLPRQGATNEPIWGLANITICTQTDHAILKDGFRSFPSGHSSTSFSGLGYLSFFLAGKLHVMDNRGEVWKTIVVLIPLLAAALVAASRIMDARHHPFDVITGSMLGLFTAWIAYRQYFPPLSKPQLKGRAFPRRTWGTEASEYAIPANNGLRMVEEGRGGTESLDFNGVGRKRVGLPHNLAYGQSTDTIELQDQAQPAPYESRTKVPTASRPSVDSVDIRGSEYRPPPGDTDPLPSGKVV